MKNNKYDSIYRSLLADIRAGEISPGQYLPPENAMTKEYGCSRNTARRAIAMLTADGYVMPQHGKGVRVIQQPSSSQNIFAIGGIESFAEATEKNHVKSKTKVITFRELQCDKVLSVRTGFDIGAELFYIERRRIINGKALIFDTNIFLKSETPGLTKEIASQSIYSYLENDLGMTITASRRKVTAEKAEKKDVDYLDLGTDDFVLVTAGQVFNSKGIMFEYTQSRHVPDSVCFVESALRHKR